MTKTKNKNLTEIQKYLKPRYKLIKKIGEGGTSVVFLAKDVAQTKENPPLVAVKVLKTQWKGGEFDRWKYRFMKEAKVLRKLKSPHIVQIYDYQFECKYPYIVIEYCDGETIRQRLDKIGPREQLEALTVVERILKTLSEIHNSSLVHRDLKPSNVIISGFGDVKILDFGIVYEHGNKFEITHENSIVGSIQYLAPELILGSHKINFLCDFYSVGLILYELLTAKPAFKGTNQGSIIDLITKNGCPDINLFANVTVHPLTRNIIKRATAIEPLDRFQSLSIFLRHINYAKYQIIESFRKDGKTNTHLIASSDSKMPKIGEARLQYEDTTLPNYYDDVDASLGSALSTLVELLHFFLAIIRRCRKFLTKNTSKKDEHTHTKKIAKQKKNSKY